MGKNNRPRLEYSSGVIIRPPVTEQERELTQSYVRDRYGVQIADKVAESVFFALTPPSEPCSLTFTSLDGTECTIDSAEFRATLQ
jgi:hypothetical protein